MLIPSAIAALLLAVAPPAPAAQPEPVLSAQQYMEVEDIYRKVVDLCCHRKEAARKVHLEIEQMVAAGKPPEKIVALFAQRFNPQRAAEPTPSVLGTSLAAAIAGGVLAASWFVVRGTGRRAP